MSNTGYGQDRLYGAIDDDDDFIEEWRSSWEPASHTRVDEVMEQETVAAEEPVASDEPEGRQAQAEQESAPTETDVTWGSWQAAPAMGSEPETVTELLAAMGAEHEGEEEPVPASEAEEPAAPADEGAEPEAEPLVAPDDAQGPDLVDWEPSPVTTLTTEAIEESSPEPSEQGAEAPEEAEPVSEAPEEAEPDHSVGLTGAAAAALAAASAWGVWGGTPAVPAMPSPSPFPVAEPEPTDEVPPEVAAEPEASGLYVPEPEVLSIPEPQPSADEPEHPTFSAGLVTTPIPEPDMYAAPGQPPFQVPEPEPYVIPEPPVSSEPAPFARSTGDTTPIPEPGFPPYVEPVEETPEDETPQDVETFPFAAHERVHEAAGASAAYDLRVDVFAVLGFPQPAAEPDTAVGTAVDTAVDTVDDATTDTTAGDSTTEDPTPASDLVSSPADDPVAGESTMVDNHQEPEGDAHEQSEHPRWFDRAKMWAANNLYDPDEETPAAAEEAHPQDEQSR